MRIFMGLLAICINFSVKCLCVPSHCFCQFVDLLYIFWILIHCANIFSQFWLTLPLFFKSAGTMLKGVTRLVSRVHKVSPNLPKCFVQTVFRWISCLYMDLLYPELNALEYFS